MIDLRNPDWSGARVKMKDATSLTPYEYGVEYGSPARGLWNIVHTGMLVPESHQIFVCAQGCLRGVVLTAAEMGALDRFSTIAVCENNVLDGDMENLIIDGVADILHKLPKMPKAVLIFTSCIHHFIGCDLDYVYARLREKFPDVAFSDCYMNPIMRKTRTAPDPKTREQLYSFLEPRRFDDRSVNIIGNNYPTVDSGDFVKMLKNGGFDVKDICLCTTWEEYQQMAASRANIVYHPAAVVAGKTLESRLGQKFLHLPLSYDYDEIIACLDKLAAELSLKLPDVEKLKSRAEEELSKTAELLSGIPVAIDYTATPRPLGLAQLLLKHGFKVVSVYGDTFIAEEQPAFDWLKANAPELDLFATIHPKMGVLPRAVHAQPQKVLAIGQKAAYFTNTKYFVNMLEGGGLWGFDGIIRLCGLLRDGFLHERDTKTIIQVKGWGCCC